MTIEFNESTHESDAIHIVDAVVRTGRTVTMASLFLVDGELVAEGPDQQRLSSNLEAAILESYDAQERAAWV